MVGFFSEHCVEERLAGRSLATALGLDCDKNRVNFTELFWVVASQNPPTVGFVIHIKDTQIQRPSLACLPPAPGLEGAGVLEIRLVIKIKGIKDEGLALRVEDATEGLPRATTAIDIKNVRNVELSRAHQLTNVLVRSKVLLIVSELALHFAIDS